MVARVRRATGLQRVGHAGTLDPLATGVLILCVGPATRLSDYVMHATKRYRARIRLGATTTTYDAEGAIVLERDAAHVTPAAVETALSAFLGEIDQVPPMYSAIKQGGHKLYDLARAGVTVEREPRRVRIDALTLREWIASEPAAPGGGSSAPELILDVTCSAGTYIRSLAYDLGEALGVGAHLSGLTRTASGRFTLENAVPLDTLLTDPAAYLVAPSVALQDYPALVVDAAATAEIVHGRALAGAPAAGAVVMAYDSGGRLIAVLEAEGERLQPRKVFL